MSRLFDLTGLGCPLPLALARKAARPPEDPAIEPPSPVTSCADCGVRYLPRPTGSALPENGRCRACAGGAGPEVSTLGREVDRAVAPFQRRARGRR